MLKVQLPRSESAHSSLLLPRPFLSGHGTATLAFWPKPALFHKHKSCSIQCRLPLVTNKPVPKKTTPKTTTTELPFDRNSFPSEFFFGTASSAYQYEGSPFADGKTASIWDNFTHKYPEKIADGSNGDVALDSYNLYKEDVAIMKDIGVNSYRFSIAWTRILPTGKVSGGVNQKGVDYYNKLIDELLSKGIQPFATLFHWDVPQALQEEYGGCLSPSFIDDFRDYAEVCFKEFGDRVKFWSTLNEPYTFTTGGYVHGNYPPAKTDNPGTDPYIVAHNLLLSHAAAVAIYRDKYQATQDGKIGIVLNPFWMVPYSTNAADPAAAADAAAAERSLDFAFGWFMEPLTSGEYPQIMQDLVGPRLPRFYKEQSEKLKGSYDFLGVNYYTAMYTQDALPSDGVFPPENPSYDTDSYCNVLTSKDGVPIGPSTGSSWLHVYPEGLQDILVYIKNKYNSPVMYVTENGISQDSKLSKEEVLKDDVRTNSLHDHLKYLLLAIEAGVDVKGFFVWTLFDDFEWDAGFTVRFGINYVDFENGLKRDLKESALWLQKFLLAD